MNLKAWGGGLDGVGAPLEDTNPAGLVSPDDIVRTRINSAGDVGVSDDVVSARRRFGPQRLFEVEGAFLQVFSRRASSSCPATSGCPDWMADSARAW